MLELTATLWIGVYWEKMLVKDDMLDWCLFEGDVKGKDVTFKCVS